MGVTVHPSSPSFTLRKNRVKNPTPSLILCGQKMLSTKPQLSKGDASSKAYDWSLSQENDTRDSKQTHLLMEFYTEINAKEAHHSKEVGLPAWQSVCSHSNPTVTIEDPIIRENQWPKSRPKGACSQDLKASFFCYK
ncbi:hypothetical protein Tco_1255746 [Tanacetum coccineum]